MRMYGFAFIRVDRAVTCESSTCSVSRLLGFIRRDRLVRDERIGFVKLLVGRPVDRHGKVEGFADCSKYQSKEIFLVGSSLVPENRAFRF